MDKNEKEFTGVLEQLQENAMDKRGATLFMVCFLTLALLLSYGVAIVIIEVLRYLLIA